MNRILLIGLAATTITFANMSHADFTFHSNIQNACENISGQWAGSGKASNWLIGECVYNGSGMVSSVDNNGHFSMDVFATKISGSILCPKQATKQLTGICLNGSVTIQTEYGDIAGHFSTNEGNAQGTLTVSPGMYAEVSIQFQRVG